MTYQSGLFNTTTNDNNILYIISFNVETYSSSIVNGSTACKASPNHQMIIEMQFNINVYFNC